MLLLGIDLGTSSIKASVVDAQSQVCVASAQFPDSEADIISLQPGWAEQDPNLWWEYVKQAILRCHATKKYNPGDIGAIGIAYQMHGLVVVDAAHQVLRNSIIWCDSRAVEIGNKAFRSLGEQRCLSHLLNSPGNFTASKLAWVKQNEPAIYNKIHRILLPGDFIAMKLCGDSTTTPSALSEGVFWDFQSDSLSGEIVGHFGFDEKFFPAIRPVFSVHGQVLPAVAAELSLKAGTPVSYKAGDQPNNALSLNVLKPGEVAATAGTSGVIYGVSDVLSYDEQSRINSFAHVNHGSGKTRIGILLCINGTGIFNRWIRYIAGASYSYAQLNEMASRVRIGSEGLLALPFGNGAERMLNNEIVGGHFHGINFNIHTTAHLVRAVQEGIAFSFRYGFDIMKQNGVNPSVIRAGRANLFLSDLFTRSFAGVNNVAVEFYEGDGSFGAAVGAGIGAGVYANAETALQNRKPVGVVEPASVAAYDELYERWKEALALQLESIEVKKPETTTIP
jgi:xylulokinase